MFILKAECSGLSFHGVECKIFADRSIIPSVRVGFNTFFRCGSSSAEGVICLMLIFGICHHFYFCEGSL